MKLFSKKKLRRALNLFTAVTIILLIVGEIFGDVWLCNLAIHFKFQLIILLSFFAICFVIQKRALGAGISLFFAIIFSFDIFSVYENRSVVSANDLKKITLYSHNADMFNTNYIPAASAAALSKADVVILMEIVPNGIMPVTTRLSEIYPWHASNGRIDAKCIHVWSKIPFDTAIVLNLSTDPIQIPLLLVRFKDWSLLAVHMMSPVSERRFNVRNEQVTKLAKITNIESLTGKPVIVAGDFNMSPYDPYFKTLLKNAGLWDSRRGVGIQPSWPSIFFPFFIPIDHILVTPDVNVIERKVLGAYGSDHYAVECKIGLKPQNNSLYFYEKNATVNFYGNK